MKPKYLSDERYNLKASDEIRRIRKIHRDFHLPIDINQIEKIIRVNYHQKSVRVALQNGDVVTLHSIRRTNGHKPKFVPVQHTNSFEDYLLRKQAMLEARTVMLLANMGFTY